jgi:hypothetical protein
MRRSIAILVLLGFLPLANVACFGSFQRTRKLYQFNRQVSPDKWVRWLVSLGMAIFPVYEFGMLIDAIFANSVEFWGGRNPFAAGDPRTRVAIGPAGEVLRASRDEAGVISLEYTDSRGEARRFTLAEGAEGISAFDARGRLLAAVVERAGEPVLVASAR